ncbi:hypothetical protein TELCIR_02185 [Teladorsagia circumcincta]|uniref:STAS domain-containing protein n=1 Tax=Teladorsagia circumcincta TaxID=45464 RepID=A0A2G9UZU3_TELCI|nr:hypothetical protein TELCIR_02185 [Teladorsagia circumcincta]
MPKSKDEMVPLQVVWVATAVITICWDIIAGLVTGIVLALITIVSRTQRPSIALLGEVDRSDYRAIDNYTRAKRTNTPILRFDAPVIFTNVELLMGRVGRILKQETGSVIFFFFERFQQSLNSVEGSSGTEDVGRALEKIIRRPATDEDSSR